MPNIDSSIRQLRTDAKRTTRNKGIRSDAKAVLPRRRKLLTPVKLTKPKLAASMAISTLDKAAGKGIIHPNNAARRKARLVKKLNAVKK